ncbi:MAG: phosphopantothenate/pantothenate synthetase [Thermoplasmata archaeon]|nr:phosphopantothenate/pantothenate synthetase [Thermoplasmata archaeon]MCI4357124.1 phosphopantothenate/pantothenate synthetase [Thermoplasmata archaeon]
MTRISPRHPRYRSLRTRATLAELARSGLVAPEGLIAHGRGEAFDYFLGERTTPSARRAIRAAARWLVNARTPVISVNGNVAALAAPEVARLQRAVPSLRVEVNLFHRTPTRVRQIAHLLEAAGVRDVLGLVATGRIPGLPSDRAIVDRRGILAADVCLVPLEDGDRTLALRRLGKKVIAIDLNPLSRTAETADLPIIDELTRALTQMAVEVGRPRPRRAGEFPPFDATGALRAARRTMSRRLAAGPRRRAPGRSASPRRVRGTTRRSRRTP